MNLEGERSLLGEKGSGCCVEGSGSGACGPWLNRVINVPANIRLAFGGARGKFHSSPVGELRQPRTIVDIITRLIKHYNCKSTEICHGRLRHCGCPLQTRLFHSLSLSLSLPVLEILVASRGDYRVEWSEKPKKMWRRKMWRECVVH